MATISIVLFYILCIVRVACLITLGRKGAQERTQTGSRQKRTFFVRSWPPTLVETEVDTEDVVREINLQNDQVTELKSQWSVAYLKPSTRKMQRKFVVAVQSLFLPVGFPATVPSEYSIFQSWNILQDFCSYLRSIMATRAILEGMGVGRADATAVQATIQWIFRDGASMIGGLLFTSLTSHDFGQNVKIWRLFADTINNIGITLEMVAPCFPRSQFLPIVCVASVCKALCGVAAGATGAAIAEHWGEKHGNIADVLAKNNAQHTLCSVCGLLFTVPFTSFSTSTPRLLWSVYSVLTAIHIYANYQAMRTLALRSVNRSRFSVLVDTLVSSPVIQQELNTILIEQQPQLLQSSTTTTSTASTAGSFEADMQAWLSEKSNLFSVRNVAKLEPILGLMLPRWCQRLQLRLHQRGRNSLPKDRNCGGAKVKIHLWAAPSMLLTSFTPAEITSAMEQYEGSKYFIISHKTTSNKTNPITNTDSFERNMNHSSKRRSKCGDIYVCFSRDANEQDQARATLEATILHHICADGCTVVGSDPTITSIRPTVVASRLMNRIFPSFWSTLEQNDWKLGLLQLRPRSARAYTILTTK